MNILITGGAGYLGSIMVPALLAKGYSVTVLDNLMFRQTSLLSCCADENFNFVRGDARNKEIVKRSEKVRERVDGNEKRVDGNENKIRRGNKGISVFIRNPKSGN